MSDQGKEYAAHIAGELKAEHDRRDAVNSRAAASLTATTALVTLVVAVFTVLKGKDFTLDGGAKLTLVVALLAMLATAALSLLAGLAKSYDAVDLDTLRAMTNAHWTDSETTARNITAFCNIRSLETLRKGTNLKYRILWVAGICQIAAVFALIVCTGFVVL
ncbi:hypothetical protein [Nocardia blacklockiae]|uniref:hypothetical protein n=1 Tax=Nocardia blacklockiae TaxID=480036 RepID=UPI001894944E|nr:hypothetical protein [Nocardia blacklockiae]MBF6175011.1 hypothetical protein [Nocardia blacklockiae]